MRASAFVFFLTLLLAAMPAPAQPAGASLDAISADFWARNLPRQADISKVERLADWLRYSMGVMPLSASCSRCSL